MDWGSWEGCKGADLKADPTSGYRDLEAWGLDFRPPAGEPVQSLVDRVTHWLANLENDTVAVCHIGVMRALLCAVSDWNFEGPAPVPIKRNRLYIIDNKILIPETIPLQVKA